MALLGSDTQGLTSSNDGLEWCIKDGNSENILEYMMYIASPSGKPKTLIFSNFHKDMDDWLCDMKRASAKYGIRIKGVT